MVRLDKTFDWILVDFCESQTSNIWDGFEWSFQDYLMDVDAFVIIWGGGGHFLAYVSLSKTVRKTV